MKLKTIIISGMALWLLSCSIQSPKKQEAKIYKPEWESLKKHVTPQWFQNAKFGIYCHFGAYCVPAFKNEWYSHWMYIDTVAWGNNYFQHHLKTYGTLDKFGYKDFIPKFKAEKFDADEWADLFQKAGAQFAGPVTEHADGFAMWNSKLTKWNAAQMGPKRDIVGELSKAIRKRNMKFIATFHHQWKYGWYPTWDKHTDASNPEFEDLYGPKVPKGTFEMPEQKTNPLPDKKFNDAWLAKIQEVIDNYHPDLIYFDSKMSIIQESTRLDMLSYYYNQAVTKKQDVVVTFKSHDLAEGSAVIDMERSRMAEKKPYPWLTDDSIDWGSWCDVSDPSYKSANRIIDYLIDVISKNGCVLLNVTPKANGEIPQLVQERLLEIGDWLKINGEAVYGTRPWKVYGEGPSKVVEGHLNEQVNTDNTFEDIRFTKKGNSLYVFVLDWPTSEVMIRSLGKKAALLDKKVKRLELLGSNAEIKWQITDEAMKITFPKEKPCKNAYALKLTLE
jgi:alpha-L-fucosidase